MVFNPTLLKKDFPIFREHPELIYLDSTATSLKPKSVLDKMNVYYTKYSANIHRGIYKISEEASEEYEAVRGKVANFIGAKNFREIIFCRNATEAINIVVSTWGRHNLTGSDSIVTSIMEHHANFVTWQELAKLTNCNFLITNITSDGKLDEQDLFNKVNKSTKLVALTHISNVLGTINPIKKIIKKIKDINPDCMVLIDGAQAAPHLKVNVNDLGCDFYVFSAHKMLGPTGVGVLWGKYEILDQLPPYQFGGDMIQAVYKHKSEYKHPPYRFEAGTPDIAGVIGLGAAIDYMNKLDISMVREHEINMTDYALKKLDRIKGLKILGPEIAVDRCGVIAFTMSEAHPHDIAQILDSDNICIRSGHHCAMPLHICLNLSATARAPFYVYTTRSDIDKFIKSLNKVQQLFH